MAFCRMWVPANLLFLAATSLLSEALRSKQITERMPLGGNAGAEGSGEPLGEVAANTPGRSRVSEGNRELLHGQRGHISSGRSRLPEEEHSFYSPYRRKRRLPEERGAPESSSESRPESSSESELKSSSESEAEDGAASS